MFQQTLSFCIFSLLLHITREKPICLTKVIRNLPIDQNFKTLARIYGRVGESEQFITHDCPLDDTNTKKWQCLVNTNKYIESIQVCNGKNDCTEEGVDWSDESDEAPERCKGANNKMIAICSSNHEIF